MHLTYYCTNATRCTRISRCSQLHNAHTYIDVGRVAVNKNECCNLNHFDMYSFRNPKTFLLFWFHIYAIDYLASCYDHFITLFYDMDRLTIGAKVEFVYNILKFVPNFMYHKLNFAYIVYCI